MQFYESGINLMRRDKLVDNPGSYAGQSVLTEYRSQLGNTSATMPTFQQFVRYMITLKFHQLSVTSKIELFYNLYEKGLIFMPDSDYFYTFLQCFLYTGKSLGSI